MALRGTTVTDNIVQPSIILVADRTLSANYKILFEGIFATMQTTHVPKFAMRKLLSPPVRADISGRAKTAPIGLRRIESSLMHFTNLAKNDIVCTTPEKLPSLLGPWVKIIAFSSSDPLGIGMSNTTTTSFWSGRLYTSYWTEKMLTELKPFKDKYNFKVIAGGAGVWQFKANPQKASQLGIDIIYEGYFESSGPELFSQLLQGQDSQSYLFADDCTADSIKPIQAASMLGIIELTRGCGRGCRFCTMAKVKPIHLPTETILSDLQTNISAGITSVVSASEDFFRYGSMTTKPDFEKLHDLLTQMQQLKGLSFMQLDHANITSVLQFTDDQLKEIRTLLTWRRKTDYLWVNMGVESANGRLVARNSPGKIAPFNPDDWPQMVLDAADKLKRTGFFGVYSVILGLPGENPDDVKQTLKLIKKLQSGRAVVFPIFYQPVLNDEIENKIAFTLDKMRPYHLELYISCYENNFKQVPKLIWDNQTAGSVPWTKRALMQMLGKFEVYSWRSNFKKVAKMIAQNK